MSRLAVEGRRKKERRARAYLHRLRAGAAGKGGAKWPPQKKSHARQHVLAEKKSPRELQKDSVLIYALRGALSFMLGTVVEDAGLNLAGFKRGNRRAPFF